MNKKIISIFFTGLIAVSSVFCSMATVDNGGQQNDPYFGLPYEPDQLGEYDTNGFLYSSAPFTDMHASDKGLIPSPVSSTYKSPSTWAKDEVLEASKMNLNNMEIITGYQGYITRAEFAKLMVQAYLKYAWQAKEVNKYIPADWEEDIFNDIENIDNKDYITWAYYLDITRGTGNGNFSPNAKITRQEMATMLYRYILIFDKTFAYNQSVAKNFDDDAQIADWAKKEVRTIANREVILGYPGNLFKPLENATREQALLLDVRTNKTFVDPQVDNNLATPLSVDIQDNKLTWNAVNGAQYYVIYKKNYLSNTEYELTYYKRTNSTSFSLEDLNKHAGTYEFEVQAFNEFYNSPASDFVTVIIPEAVDKNTILWDNATDILSWTGVPNAAKYRVEVTGSNYSQTLETTNLNVTLSGIQLGKYTAYITAYSDTPNNNNNAFYSATTTSAEFEKQ